MSWHRTYRGRSIGRVLHGLETYCTCPGLDSTQVGDGKVTLFGKLFARYWFGTDDDPDGDIPCFIFEEKEFNKNQTILRPFLDEPCYQSPTYIVQEVRNCLTYPEALAIRWVREGKGEWEHTITLETAEKIKKVINEATWDKMRVEWVEKHWQHFAMCAIMDI